MDFRIPPGMAEAARLTRSGKLAEATSLIQDLLHGRTHPERPAEPEHAGPTIDHEPADPRPPRRKPRKGLGETLRDLASAKLDLGPGVARGLAPDPIPDGASFRTETHAGAAGTREYKLYVPANRGEGRLALVVMLHGCTQSPDDFAAGTRMNALAEEHGFLVAYPAQSPSANPQKCWNWFRAEDQRRGEGEPELIAGITRRVIRDHPVDPARVYIAGLSAGGAAAVIMAAAYPELYAAVGVHSGLPAGAAHDLPSALGAMRQGAAGRGHGRHTVPTIVFHGDRDTTVHPRNADAVAAQSAASGAGLRSSVERGRADGGHGFSRTLHHDPAGRVLCEHWTIHGAGHAWSGGSPSGSYTDPRGPDASREMLRFFLANAKTA